MVVVGRPRKTIAENMPYLSIPELFVLTFLVEVFQPENPLAYFPGSVSGKGTIQYTISGAKRRQKHQASFIPLKIELVTLRKR